jgi:UDP-N-acetylglucosamine 2-epimerase (non-hydrolysing)
MGARPNFVKAAALWRAAQRDPRIDLQLIHTGQHYTRSVSAEILRDLGMDAPACQLEPFSGTSEAQAQSIRDRLHAPLLKLQPDVVIVVGDVTSTVASARAAHDLGMVVAHVEAGLRSFDSTMPEERNRIEVDRLANQLFATEAAAVDNLRREGTPEERIHLVGNVMIDSLDHCLPAARQRQRCKVFGLDPGRYGLVTLHRANAVDDPASLRALIEGLGDASRRLPLLFPVHPRTAAALAAMEPRIPAAHAITFLPPQGYLDFLSLLATARLVVTDSGGVQEEALVLGVPCLTLRDNTERPVTLGHGGNVLLGCRPDRLDGAIAAVLAAPSGSPRRPPGWDGHAAARVLDVLWGAYGAGRDLRRGSA